MLPDVVAASSGSGLEDRAGDPAMALVIDGVGFLQIREAAVLWFERGLQVSPVVDGVRPGVAGKQFEAPGHAFLYVNGERVVPGAGVGKLRVHAVEGNWNAEANRIAGQMCKSNLVRVTTCGRSEGWVRSGRTEEVEESWRADEAYRRSWIIAVRRSETLSEYSGHNQLDTSSARVYAWSWTRGDNDGARILDAKTRSCCVKGVLVQQLGIGGIDVHRPI